MEQTLYDRSVTSGLQTAAIAGKGEREERSKSQDSFRQGKRERESACTQDTASRKGEFLGNEAAGCHKLQLKGKKVTKQPPHGTSAMALYPRSPHRGEDHHRSLWGQSDSFQQALRRSLNAASSTSQFLSICNSYTSQICCHSTHVTE